MTPKKASIKLRILGNEVSDYFRGSYFGVPAMDQDVLRLWKDFNDLLLELQLEDPDRYSDFQEVPYPAPYLADEESFYREGTMIYKPEHFAPLRLAIENLLKFTIPLAWERESA